MSVIPADFKKIFRNFFSLNLVQLTNIALPLIVLPYVVRVIGVEKFGLISFVQSFIMYFAIITDYGFSLAGTREIALNKNDSYKLSEVFYSIFILKLFMGIVCLSIILILINSFDFFGNNRILYLISTGILFGSIFFPQWFFQGIEKMEIIPLINISLKVVQLILIFLLVKTETDYAIYLLIIAATQLVIGLTGFTVSLGTLKYKPFFPDLNQYAIFLKKHLPFFLQVWR